MNTIVISADCGKHTISRHIYGQFLEHTGSCVYGGAWVGSGSDIPNTRGWRNDVIEALQKIQVPNIRWPGGNFAEAYRWRDGIGPVDYAGVIRHNRFVSRLLEAFLGAAQVAHAIVDDCDHASSTPLVEGTPAPRGSAWKASRSARATALKSPSMQ